MGNIYLAEMEIDDEELEAVYREFQEAKEKMASCIRRLEEIGFLKIKMKTDSPQSDESVQH